MTPDVNVLVAAYRADHTNHTEAITWLAQAREKCAVGSETLTLLPMVLTGFLRLVTSARVFAEPDTIEDAMSFIDALIDTPGVDLRACGDEWALLRSMLLGQGLSRNLVTDAWIAAAVQSLSEHLVTFDRDFKRLLPPRDFTLLGSA